ncbi:DNA-processing protein DprA [Legionella londiniensis]|uniref:Protein smf n=1 Tax=Legionella londiniensis TaxID=45068 RepID=A0A0W0VRC1_9GAMM|nr:DNA-processing protein DprA [Legionella londiniensis]KTD22538.1 protein smf [Legionella londiniensis]STX92469.1 protein smf [Legionella londiniensis]
MNNKYYLLALNHLQQVGPRTIQKMLNQWPELAEMFRSSKQALIAAGLTEKIAHAIKTFDFTKVERDFRWQESVGHHLLSWADETYPRLLREIYDAPPVLYAAGDLAALEHTAAAMVGTRNPSATGMETAWRFAYELASKQIAIVSGLALGIDTKAHEGCLAAKGKTIAVMATGIDHIYPRQNQKLAESIIAHGLLCTEFPLGTAPIAGHFPRRNRIISGLSLITLVVEAAIRSGSLITARLALEQNRDVLAIPGSIYNPKARGCHYLLQQGAKLVTSSEDVLAELGLDYSQERAKDLNAFLACENENLVKCIGFEATTIDQISERSGFTIDKVVCELAELEIKGIVKAVPGGYMRCGL